jgi:hypothetical protein
MVIRWHQLSKEGIFVKATTTTTTTTTTITARGNGISPRIDA